MSDLLKLVRRADEAVMEVYDANSAVVQTKDDDSPITQADMASHHILVDGLARLFPDVPIVSEEGDQQANAAAVSGPLFWLVDPIDGTKEFIARTGDFTVCLAFVQDGVPVFGIISAPAYGTTYYGGPGMGSFKVEADSAPQPIHVAAQKLHVVVASRGELNPETADYIARQYPGATIDRVGSQLKIPYVAEGRADAYPRIVHGMKVWDVAAGDAILTGAGGKVTRPDGSAVDYQAVSLLVGDFVASA